MKKINTLITGFFGLMLLSVLIAACTKDVAPESAPAVVTPSSLSITESFDNVGSLAAKGWLIKNNSNPVGTTGWRQGRYENNVGGSKAGLVIGMPAYSSNNDPHDFVSCDATCVNNAGEVNAWLITPQTTVKNGDVITFYTKAMNDQDWGNFAQDRMQLRANFVDGSTDCGTSGTDFGKFTTLLVDVNPTLANNDPGGYPQVWTKRTVTISGLTGSVKARFAFRYLAPNGGLAGLNPSSLVGVDEFSFESN